MPITSHESFIEPNKSSVLWRYMDLARFSALISGGQLWFSNAELLAEEDPQEGLLPPLNFTHRDWELTGIPPYEMEIINNRTYFNPDDSKILEKDLIIKKEIEHRELVIKYALTMRRSYFVNCWHNAKHESAGMWKTYGPGPGIAITSNPERIKRALEDNKEDMNIGSINYIDINTQAVDIENMFNIIVTKRNNYDYEKEVRIVYWNTSFEETLQKAWNSTTRTLEIPDESNFIDFQRSSYIAGYNFPCKLNELIDCIWVSPRSPTWYIETINRLCHKFDVRAEVRPSVLFNSVMR